MKRRDPGDVFINGYPLIYQLGGTTTLSEPQQHINNNK